jgi:hypothetical protein
MRKSWCIVPDSVCIITDVNRYSTSKIFIIVGLQAHDLLRKYKKEQVC